MTLVMILCVYTLVFVGISAVQIAFLQRQKAQKAVILDEKTYKEAADIAITNEKFGIFSRVYTLVLYALWVFFGFAWLGKFIISTNSTLDNTLFLLAFLIVNMPLTLPLSVYEDFVKNKKQGFSTMSAGLFVKDTLKSLILLVIFGFLLIYALIFCYEFLGQFWWLAAFGVAFAAILIANVLYPTLIAPMFNKMQKLDDKALQDEISALMNKCGFSSKGVFVMDASKRDKRLNAYFGGLFKSKRVVLFDTLLKAMSARQLLAVLGHELGHFVHKDLLKGLLNGALMIFLLFFAFAHLSEISNFLGLPDFYEQANLVFAGENGTNEPLKSGVFVLLLLLGEVFSFVFAPFINAMSRKHEFAADKHGAQMTSSSDMREALLVLAKENKAFVKSSKLYELFHLSHPSIDERLKALA